MSPLPTHSPPLLSPNSKSLVKTILSFEVPQNWSNLSVVHKNKKKKKRKEKRGSSAAQTSQNKTLQIIT
jgi:hypothetical protein